MQVFFAILVGAFYVGQSGPNLERVATAQGAAGVLYDIIDTVSITWSPSLCRAPFYPLLPHPMQQPTIDTASNQGTVPEKSESSIQFNNVCFSYPTRPDVKVGVGLVGVFWWLCVWYYAGRPSHHPVYNRLDGEKA